MPLFCFTKVCQRSCERAAKRHTAAAVVVVVVLAAVVDVAVIIDGGDRTCVSAKSCDSGSGNKLVYSEVVWLAPKIANLKV